MLEHLFKIKFATRVRHYYRYSYCVEYTCYIFFPIWWVSLKRWILDPSYDGGLLIMGDWYTVSYSSSEAERQAARYKSIDDINSYWEQQRRYKRDQIENYKTQKKRNIPYNTKIINKIVNH